MSRRPSSRVLFPLMALIAVVSASFMPPAKAEGTITTQSYVNLLNLGALKELSISGEGIAVALIDGPVDTPVPELQGVDTTTVTSCPCTLTPNSISHGMAMAFLLVSPDCGTAPGATATNYTTPLRGGDLTQEGRRCATGFTRMMTLALNNGIDIISYLVGGDPNGAMTPTPTKADLDGTIVVVAIGNNDQEDCIKSCTLSDLTVNVVVADIHGNRAGYSNYGKGITAALYGGPVSARDYPSGRIHHETKGTSVITALTSGYLAPAMEKWPEATNEQILQSLVRTTVRDDGVEWNPGYGYRLANPRGLLTEDPTNLPDENPLLHKDIEWLSSEECRNDYVDGLLDPGDEVITDPYYIYRGSNSSRVSLTPEKAVYGTSPRYHRVPDTPPIPPPNRHHHTPQK